MTSFNKYVDSLGHCKKCGAWGTLKNKLCSQCRSNKPKSIEKKPWWDWG